MNTRISERIEPVKGKRGILVLAAMLAAAVLLQGLVACDSNGSQGKNNKIAGLELTEEQKDVLDMAGVNTHIDIFAYQVDNSFQTLYVIRELYKDGQWFSGNTMASQATPGQGLLSIALDSKTGSLSLSHKHGGTLVSSQAMLEEEVLSGSLSSGKTWLQEETPIQDEEEIILMVTVYDGAADGMSIFNTDYYQQYPERLADYDYVHIIKCRFSSKGLEEAAGS